MADVQPPERPLIVGNFHPHCNTSQMKLKWMRQAVQCKRRMISMTTKNLYSLRISQTQPFKGGYQRSPLNQTPTTAQLRRWSASSDDWNDCGMIESCRIEWTTKTLNVQQSFMKRHLFMPVKPFFSSVKCKHPKLHWILQAENWTSFFWTQNFASSFN
jgi:hypothetical protein